MKLHTFTGQGDRPYQEDAFTIIEGSDWKLLVVADGMGGHANGAAASAAVISEMTKISEQIEANKDDAHTFIVAAIELAHQTCLQAGDRRGSTAVAVFIHNNKALFVNAGDSYGYIINDYDGIMSCTKVHAGWGGGITKCVGGFTSLFEARAYGNELVNPDAQSYDLIGARAIVLASDGILTPAKAGLPRFAEDENLAETIARSGNSKFPPGLADNVTVLVAQLDRAPVS